jgi:ParB family chromosome partitioning protein
MEAEGNIPEEDRGDLLDEFLYLYQIMGILIPDLKDTDLRLLMQD